jgi:hypothetical protein
MLHTVTSSYRELAKIAGLTGKLRSSATKKQELLLKMATMGENKPTAKPHWRSPLGRAFTNYIGKNSNAYDPDFVKQTKKLAPHWLLTRSEIVDNKKQKLLEMARKKLPRPLQKTRMGQCLSSYTIKSSDCYDPAFTKQIKKLAPHWFEKAL